MHVESAPCLVHSLIALARPLHASKPVRLDLSDQVAWLYSVIRDGHLSFSQLVAFGRFCREYTTLDVFALQTVLDTQPTVITRPRCLKISRFGLLHSVHAQAFTIQGPALLLVIRVGSCVHAIACVCCPATLVELQKVLKVFTPSVTAFTLSMQTSTFCYLL